MTYEEFQAKAHRMWEWVPAEYREGVDGIVVHRRAETHPEHDDFLTMGMCFSEPYPSGYGSPESSRSILALYHGSFSKLSETDPDFSWEEELWETITHELRHHLEFQVEGDALEREDYAAEQSHRRSEGLAFDPWYFQSGTAIAPDVYRVDREFYIEQVIGSHPSLPGDSLTFDWDGRRWVTPLPEDPGDVHYIAIPRLAARGFTVQLVLVRELSLWQRIKRLWLRTPLVPTESEGQAQAMGKAPSKGPGTAGERA